MDNVFDTIAVFLTGFLFGFGFKELAEIIHSYTKRFQAKIEQGL